MYYHAWVGKFKRTHSSGFLLATGKILATHGWDLLSDLLLAGTQKHFQSKPTLPHKGPWWEQFFLE